MQTPSSNPKKNSARRRSADPHARLSARLRHISFGAAVLLVVVAALTVIYSLYKIQIRDGATYRQYAAEQQLLDSTIQATRGEIYDTSGITPASTSRSMISFFNSVGIKSPLTDWKPSRGPTSIILIFFFSIAQFPPDILSAGLR